MKFAIIQNPDTAAMQPNQTIAIIPARGGSKRIPKKNIRSFCGRPMIAYSIEAAIESKVFDSVVISTDDKEIAAVAESLGAQVPFIRPPELSHDHAATMPVIAHAIRWWEENRAPVEFACCIYATAPFLRAGFLRQGFQLLRETSNAEFTFSVTSYPYPIFRAMRITELGRLEMIWPENEEVRSQDLPEAWHDAGQFYWGRKSVFLENPSLCKMNAYPVILPRYLVQDIDTLDDWEQAELMFRSFQSNHHFGESRD